MCLVFSTYLLPVTSWLQSMRSLSIADLRLSVFVQHIVHHLHYLPPVPWGSNWICTLSPLLPHDTSLCQHEPTEGVIEDTQNSHYNERWQDVTHSAIDQPPPLQYPQARWCHPCTHLHPSSWVCLWCDVTRAPRSFLQNRSACWWCCNKEATFTLCSEAWMNVTVLCSHLMPHFYHPSVLMWPCPVCPPTDTSDLWKNPERAAPHSLWPLAVFDHWLSYRRLRDS